MTALPILTARLFMEATSEDGRWTVSGPWEGRVWRVIDNHAAGGPRIVQTYPITYRRENAYTVLMRWLSQREEMRRVMHGE